MKKLLLIRHAKSSWENFSLSDFDRTLNKRGLKDSFAMPKFLKEKGVEIDFILSSTAVRAKTTATNFNSIFNLKEDALKFTTEIYNGQENTVLDLIEQMDNKVNHLAVFGHNPTFTMLANQICELRLDNLPTCGVVCIAFNIEKWSEIKTAEGKFLFIEYPKKLNG